MFKRYFVIVLALLLAISVGAPKAQATTHFITGKFALPNTNLPLGDATISFDLSQAAIEAGAFAIAPSTMQCFTDHDGNMAGMPNPKSSNFTVSATTGGTIAGGTYYVKISWVNNTSGIYESNISSVEKTVVVSGGNNAIQLTFSGSHTNATGFRIYVQTTSGAEVLQDTQISFSPYKLTSYSASGNAMPTFNGYPCSIDFNDQLIPFGTTYKTNVIDVNGNQIAGFPQDWWLAGNSVDVTNNYPVAVGAIRLRFPTPIIQNPSSNAQQSVNSPLTLNGYALTAGSLGVTELASPATACASGKTVIWVDSSTHLTKICENGGASVALLGSANGWGVNGSLTYSAVTTNRVMVGFNAVGDFSSSTFDGNIFSKNFMYALSANTNATVAGLGYDGGSTTVRLASGISGSGTPRDLAVTTYNGGNVERSRWDTQGRFLHHITSTDSSDTTGIFVQGGFYSITGTTNASVGGFVYDGVSQTMRLSSGITGAGAVKPLAFVLYNATGATNDEWGRLTPVNNAAASAKVFNLEVNDNAGSLSSDFHTPIIFNRSANQSEFFQAGNHNNGTLSSAGFRAAAATAGADADVYVGVTSSNYTTANGITASSAFIVAATSTTGGIQIQANAGSVKIMSGATTKMTIGSGGVTLDTALPVTSGGTGSVAAWNATGNLLFAGSTSTTLTSANITWDNTNRFQTLVGGFVAASDTRHNPAGGTSVLHMFMDSTGPLANIVAADYTGPTYKNLKLSGLTVQLNANGTDVLYVTSTGPKWQAGFSTNAAGGGTNLSLTAVTFPGSTTGIPYVWLKAVAADGTDVWIPAWK